MDRAGSTPSGTSTGGDTVRTGARCMRSMRRGGKATRLPGPTCTPCVGRWLGSASASIGAAGRRRATTSISTRPSRPGSKPWPAQRPTKPSTSTACAAGATSPYWCCSTIRVRPPKPARVGHTVHEQQRAAAAALVVALHELGDRVALYAFNSQGRAAVQPRAGQALRRQPRRAGDAAPRQSRRPAPTRGWARRSAMAPRSSPRRRRDAATAARRAVRRVGLRPRLRARCTAPPTRDARWSRPADEASAACA